MTKSQQQASDPSAARMWEETVPIPTYPALAPDLNPMFIERRIYQGSKGNIYPIPLIDRLSSELVDRDYKAVYLENEYIQLMVLPELGGRIQVGLDKTNNYDFIYRNRVIKPALVGLAGPWISGGLEFNWPQHHRPTTFMPVDCALEENEDGSKTCWVGEIDPMVGMKGMAGITIYPGRSYFEVKVRLYNATPLPQSFMWWANLGVHANLNYQVLYPPDIHYVADHAKRAIITFPIATGEYYGIDYSPGVDLSWYKNIPVPTSYMVLWSDYDFWGGYDHGRQAGVMHIANHHIVPGKKLFTWGAGDFGRGWFKNLTDDDGPYIELMTGAFTDNQPDFSWMQPYETRTFSQYWYPLRQIGQVKHANLDAAVNLEVQGDKLFIRLNTTGVFENTLLTLKDDRRTLWQREISVAPDQPYETTVELEQTDDEAPLTLVLLSAEGKELISYTPLVSYPGLAPQPASVPDFPEKHDSVESLYLTGLHLEQYRHPSIDPQTYYGEALRRDPNDVRCNNALGLIYLRQGEYAKAAETFRRAIATLTQKNPNPYDGEPFYNLGLALKSLEQYAEAYKAFYKSTWNYPWQAAGYYSLAELDCLAGEWDRALEHLDRCLSINIHHLKARNLKACLLRRTGRVQAAIEISRETVEMDVLDYWSRYELYKALSALGEAEQADRQSGEFKKILHNQTRSYLSLAVDYASAGLGEEAFSVLFRLLHTEEGVQDPLVYYHLAYYAGRRGDERTARQFAARAAQMPSDYCFPNRLVSIDVLLYAQEVNPQDARAPYYLGNLLYDKQRYTEAIHFWEKSRSLDSSFSIIHRNLGMAYYNLEKDPQKARLSFQRAFALNPTDPRLLFELDQLEKRRGTSPQERLKLLDTFQELVYRRDDLYLTRVELHNQLGQYDTALDLLTKRTFKPWEGGEGKVAGQYIQAHLLRGYTHLENGRHRQALDDFSATLNFPPNLGEGRHEVWLSEANLFYHLGLAYDALGDTDQATQYYEKAASEKKPNLEMEYWRGLALQKLNKGEEARQKFDFLVTVGGERLTSNEQTRTIETSLPTLTILQDDPATNTRIEGHYLSGLGYLGLGDLQKAAAEFEAVLTLDRNHLGAQSQLGRIHPQVKE